MSTEENLVLGYNKKFLLHIQDEEPVFGGDTRMHCKDMCELAQNLLLMVSSSKANGWFSTVAIPILTVLLKICGILEMKSIVSILNQKKLKF